MKTRRNYSFAKASRLINKIIAENLNMMANYQNEAIQAGIYNKRDINGKSYVPLSEDSTLPIRNARKQGFTPLDRMKGARQKKLRNTKILRATQNKLVSKIKMMTAYGVFHNQGFTTSPKSMIPSQKVPARNWFGISTEMRPKGRKYKVFVRMAMMKIKQSLRK